MTPDQLVAAYRAYLIRQRSLDESGSGKLYLKDKTSRLRALLRKLDVRCLSNLTSRNFHNVCDKVMDEFSDSYKDASGKIVYKYSRYLVVLRQLYEMNTSKPAPRYIHFNGVRKVVKSKRDGN